MANDFKNTNLVTKFAVKEFLNALVLTKRIDRQLDKGVYNKVGATVNVRRPVMFASEPGATIGVVSDIEEGLVPVTLDQREKVAFTVSSEDQTLKIEDANERYIRPAMQELAQKVESHLASLYSSVFNFSGIPGTAPATYLDVANVMAKLDLIGVPSSDRCALFDPQSIVTLADGLKGVFPQGIAKNAIEQAKLGRYAGFDTYSCQSIKNHTVGVATGVPLVNGAAQNVTYLASKDTQSQTLNTDGWTASTAGILKAGDVFSIAGVNSVNRRTREDTGQLAQFVVIKDANSGALTGPAALTISPPIITAGPYQTVSAAPADNAAITVLSGASGSVHKQSLAFHKNAFTLACAKLDLPQDGASASRVEFDNISIRTVKQYDINSDRTTLRFDILFGAKTLVPEFACRITN